MADTFSKEKRSEIMSKIGSKGTKPEMKIRRGLHSLGYRYSLHDKKLPGKPDLKLPKYNALMEINGCFWHGHDCNGEGFRLPKSRKEYWSKKINYNRNRDKKNTKALLDMGWRLLIIWECSMKGKNSYKLEELIIKIEKWLHSNTKYLEIDSKK